MTAEGVYVINPPGEAGTESGEWEVEGDPGVWVSYTRGAGDTREAAEIRGPLGAPLDLGVRNNKRSRWPGVTQGIAHFIVSFALYYNFVVKELLGQSLAGQRHVFLFSVACGGCQLWPGVQVPDSCVSFC